MDGDPAASGGNPWGVGRVRRRVEPEEAEFLADPRAHRRTVLPDAADENERVQSTERGGKATDPFACLVAEQGDRVGGARVLRLARQQVTHVGAGFRNPQQPGPMVDHIAELPGGHPFGSAPDKERDRGPVVPGPPIWSNWPDNTRSGEPLPVKNANLMLDDPTLTVRTRASV